MIQSTYSLTHFRGPPMVWNKPEIIRTLKRLYKSGADLSYNALASKKQCTTA